MTKSRQRIFATRTKTNTCPEIGYNIGDLGWNHSIPHKLLPCSLSLCPFLPPKNPECLRGMARARREEDRQHLQQSEFPGTLLRPTGVHSAVGPPYGQGQPKALLKAGWRGTESWVVRMQRLRIVQAETCLGPTMRGVPKSQVPSVSRLRV